MTELVLEAFQPHAGGVFILHDEALPPMELTLETVEPLTNHVQLARPPFSLIFRCPDMQVLPQRIYCLEHPAMGEISLFLVPVAQDAGGVQYQALFN
jgi:hypothetical protein